MSAYEESYLFDAMNTLGEAFDCAERSGLGMQRFAEVFVACGIAEKFGGGCPLYIAGVSGAELFMETCERSFSIPVEVVTLQEEQWSETECYWCGWILAYIQWKTGLSFARLLESVPAQDLRAMYSPYHEMDEDSAAEAVLARIGTGRSRLKEIRKARALTQADLASRSGVSLRAIQQYEQGSKDISKAQARYVHNLARTLGCRMEDLLGV